MYLKLLCLLIISSILAACASNEMALTIQSVSYLNPDINGLASPVVVSIYQLKAPYNFNNADYDSLAANSSAILGSDLIDKQTAEIRPAENKVIRFELSPSTQYIGIVAAYRTIDIAQWHTAIQVPNNKRSKHMTINLESQGLIVTGRDT